MKYKAIIFDLDGVLTHTDQYHFQAWKELADELGIPFDEKVNHQLRGISRMDSLEVILRSYPGELPKDKKKYAEQKNQRYRELLSAMTPQDLEPEVKETLEILRQRGYKMGVGSSSKNARYILEKLGLEDFFDGVVDGNDVVQTKPDPEVFLKASRLLGVAPEQCLVIEDAKAGVEAALGAGMDCAGIGDAVDHPQATYSLNHLSEIIHVLEKESG